MPAIVESLLGIKVNQSQVYRISQQASLLADEPLLDAPSQKLAQIESNKQETVYGMVDGSMLFTDNGWQETKVGRVFKATPVKDSLPGKWHMDVSEYVAQRGHYSKFKAKFEKLLAPNSACKKVFITDGARWIGNWLSERYPEAVHILDFFHVSEKIAFAAQFAPDSSSWREKQNELLRTGAYKQVMKAVSQLEHFPAQEKEKLLHYLQSNTCRMQYDEYRKQGLMISSGPIESAHRTLLQVRMKRSGQRWADQGL